MLDLRFLTNELDRLDTIAQINVNTAIDRLVGRLLLLLQQRLFLMLLLCLNHHRIFRHLGCLIQDRLLLANLLEQL